MGKFSTNKLIDVGYKAAAGILSSDGETDNGGENGTPWYAEGYGLSPNQLASDTWAQQVPYAAASNADTVLDTGGVNAYPYITKKTVKLFWEAGTNNMLWMARDDAGNRLRNFINPANHLSSSGATAVGYTVKLYKRTGLASDLVEASNNISTTAGEWQFFYKEGALAWGKDDTPSNFSYRSYGLGGSANNAANYLWAVIYQYEGVNFEPDNNPSTNDILSYDGSSMTWVTAASGGDITTDTEWDALGDLIVATADNAADRLPVGSNDQVLTADSNATHGVKWADATGSAQGNINIVQSNPSHTFAANSSGVVNGYGGSGNTIQVYRNGVAMDRYSFGSPVQNKWSITSATASNITVGSGGSGTDSYVYPNMTGMTSSSPYTAHIDYVVKVWDDDAAAAFNFITVTQNFASVLAEPGPAGSGYSIVMSNENHTVAAALDGSVTNFTGSGTTIKAYKDGTLLDSVSNAPNTGEFRVVMATTTGSWTVAAADISGDTYVLPAGTAMSATNNDVVVRTFQIECEGLVSFSKTLTITKVYKGAVGDDGSDGSDGTDVTVVDIENAFTDASDKIDIGILPDTVKNDQVTKVSLGISNVEDKSSATIRSEIVDSDIPSTIARDTELPTKSSLGLSNVEDKSSATIRSEIVDSDIPSTIARDTELPTKSSLGLSNVEDKSSATIRSEIVDSDIPSTIARDTELPTKSSLGLSNVEDKSSATIRSEIVDSDIPSTIARDTELPTKSSLGLSNVEDKSSATIRSEIVDSDIPSTIARDTELPTKSSLGLSNVEDKSSATIRSEIVDSDIPSTIARDTELPTKSSLGLSNVEDKSSATIRSEIVDSDIPSTIARDTELPTKASLSIDNVDNTADADKPVSTDQQTALDGKFNLSGGTLTGALITNSTIDGIDIATRDTVLTSTTTTANAALPKTGGAMTGAITTNSTFDGVDIATRDTVLTSTTTTASNALPMSGGAMTGAITTNSTFDGVDIATRDGVLTSTKNTADAAMPKSGGAFTGAITTNSTIDGVDIATRDGELTTAQTGVTDNATAITGKQADMGITDFSNSKTDFASGNTAVAMSAAAILDKYGDLAITDSTIPMGTGSSIQDSGLSFATVTENGDDYNHLTNNNTSNRFHFHTKDMDGANYTSREFTIRTGHAPGPNIQHETNTVYASDTNTRISGNLTLLTGNVANTGSGDCRSGNIGLYTGIPYNVGGTITRGTIILSGDISKLGLSTHTSGHFLKWDGTKAVWAAGSGGITTHAQDAEPTGLNDGDIWIDTNDNKKLHRYNGSSWEDMRDTRLANVTNESKATMFTSPAFTGTATAVGIRSDYFSGASTQPKWELGTNVGNYLDIISTSHIKMQLNDGYGNSSSEFSILDQAGANIWSIDLSGNIKTKGKIRDNNGNDKIDVNISGQTDFTGSIKVKGSSDGYIYGPDADDLIISSNKDLVFTIDADNDDNGKKFIFKDATTEIASLNDRGDLQVDGVITSKQREIYNQSFQDDIGTTKHYIPFKGTYEQTSVYQEEAAMVAPCNGKLISVTIRTATITGSGNLTIGLHKKSPGSSPFSGWSEVETETISVSSTDDNHVFHFAFSNARFDAADLFSVSIQSSSDLSGTNYWYVSTVMEWDWNNFLGVSSTEIES